MESLLEILTDDILNLMITISPAIIAMSVLPPLFRFLKGSLNEVGYSDSEETQKEIIPQKEIEAPAKIKTVNKARTIPRRCPYCYGILDNVDCCPYCGTEF